MNHAYSYLLFTGYISLIIVIAVIIEFRWSCHIIYLIFNGIFYTVLVK